MPRDREQEQIRAVLEAIENETTSLELSVEVDGADITVTMPGTKFSVTYQKREDSPTIVLTHTWLAPSITTDASIPRSASNSSTSRKDSVNLA